jgi:hypothetical protein
MHQARSHFFAFAGLLGLALLLPRPAAAAWPNSPGLNVPLCTAPGTQEVPNLVSDGAGGAIVTWMDGRSGTSRIHAQRISADGTVRWTANGVALCSGSSYQYYPSITSDGAGGAIVTWFDYRNGNSDIYAQRISADGTIPWTADGVALCTATGIQQSAIIISDNAGGAVVTWQDDRSGIGTDIYAQRISAAGSVQWAANGVALCAAASNQINPAITSNGGGGAIVTWLDYRSGTNYDLYTQQVSSAGSVQWAANGVALCTASSNQYSPTIAPDGAGGAIVTWYDYRSGTSNDIYAQRISAGGTVQWTVDGVALCTASGNQDLPIIVADGAGGAIVTWPDTRSVTNFDVYAQRISAAGSVQWTANGVALCADAGNQQDPVIVPDGAGGAIVTWSDYRGGTNYDVYAQRVSSTGTVRWAANGVALSTAAGNQSYPRIATDGAGGAIVVWYDYRSGTNYDIYAQRVDQWGYLGVQPTIASVKDVPNDQGGKVKLSWYASPLDSFPAYSIAEYLIYRSVPPNLAVQLLSKRPVPATGIDVGRYPGSRAIVARTEGALTTFWEYVGTVSASHKSGYSYLAPTVCDSVGGSNPRTLFMVEAITAGSAQWWDSGPDSGYSVDNLAPPAPVPFTGQYAGGAAALHWAASPAADLAGYRLYRGSTAGFVPESGNLVMAQPDTGYVDAASAPYYYKLSAVDVHGNESGFALVLPSGTADVTEGPSFAFALAGVRPNPSHGERLSVAFTLPTAAPARLELLDVSGRRVVEREVGSLGAGPHAFDLGHGGPLAPGLYLVRLTQGTNSRAAKVLVLE